MILDIAYVIQSFDARNDKRYVFHQEPKNKGYLIPVSQKRHSSSPYRASPKFHLLSLLPSTTNITIPCDEARPQLQRTTLIFYPQPRNVAGFDSAV